MKYFKDLSILQASFENIKNILRKVSNDPNVLVVGVGQDDSGNRTSGIQIGKDVTNFWEVKAVTISPSTEVNNFITDRMGGKLNIGEIKTSIAKYKAQFKHTDLVIRAVYHTQSVYDLFKISNKWIYWQDKLSFKLQLGDRLFEIKVFPEESTSEPSKDLNSAEDLKLEIGFTMKTFCGIIQSGYVFKSIQLNTKLVNKNNDVIDEEINIIEDKELNAKLIEDNEINENT